MADKPSSGIKMPDVETAIGKEGGGSVYVGEQRPSDTQTHESGGSVEVGGSPVLDKANDPRTQRQADDTTTTTEGTGDAQEPKEGDAAEGEDKAEDKAEDGALPKFDPENEEVVKAYDAKYKPNGQFDMNALSQEWWANAQANENGDGHLSDDAYAYLAKQGYSKDFVKEIEKGQFALTQQTWGGYFQRAGGKENFDKAFSWATDPKNPGYTQAQRDSFNRGLDAGGEQANDVIDLLMSRYTTADSRKVNPGNSVERGANGGGGKPPAKGAVFSSREEWIAARREAGKDTAKQQAVSDKFRRSPGAKNW